MMMPELPEDLLEEILCRVPATSLQRLRCTCKRWNVLFNDRRFTRKQHFHRAPSQSMILMRKKFVFDSMSINPHRVPPVEITGQLDLIKPHSSFGKFRISQLSQSDGLVLCVYINNMGEDTRLLVWNPCTSQTKWIQHIKRCKRAAYTYALGSYQDSKSGNNSYKILSYKFYRGPEFEIYEINSNSWRILDVTMDYHISCTQNVSLKGKTYWFARAEKEWFTRDGKKKQLELFLISFDYTTERFERLPLPYQHHGYPNFSLSVVREEKLSVLLKRDFTSKTEIWVTNKIGETKVLSWIKVLAVDFNPELYFGPQFLVDEEKKVIMCTQHTYAQYPQGQHMLYIVGEDNRVREKAFEDELHPCLFYYVPSLTQIEQGDHD